MKQQAFVHIWVMVEGDTLLDKPEVRRELRLI
jgi:hypothetical protein